MIDSLKRRLASLDSDLIILHQEETNILFLSKKAIIKIRECCRELSEMKPNYEFKGKEEEVFFFKELKAIFYSKLFYYTDIYNIESHKPNGGEKLRRKYLKEHLYKISEHFNIHRSLYQYCRTGQTAWDDRYFSLIKKYEEKYDVQGIIMQCEDVFSSTHDILFARIIANDLLEVHFTYELEKLNGNKVQETSSPVTIETTTKHPNRKLRWTGSKCSLIELVYSLVYAKAVNDGNVEYKEVVEFVEKMFGIDLGDFYRTYVELRLRTKRTKFIDSLRAALIEKMNEDDEKDKDDPLARKK